MADREEDAHVDEESEEDGEVLDLEGQGLTSIKLPDDCSSFQTLILNNNDLIKLDGLDACLGLSQLSAANNHIVHMTGLHRLTSLTVLSLANNSIGTIEGIEGLTQLMWLDLSSNSIKNIDHLPAGGKLHYLDLSDNDITYITDLSALKNLKTLLLHGNNISTLKTAATFLPQSLGVLSLADNSIYDLNEVCHLSGLHNLQQLSLSENPCVIKTPDCQAFDYRPFVWNWCPSIQILDALVITEKERLLGEWLYSQGKGRHFHIGEHVQLVEYLATICPLPSSEQVLAEEDSKLNQILSQQRQYQQQLQQERQHQWQSPQSVSTPENKVSITVHSDNSGSEQLQTKYAWAKPADLNALPCAKFDPCAVHASDLTLQDISHDFDARSSISLLESESVYLPFDVPASPVVLRRPFDTKERQPYATSKPASSVATAIKSHNVSTRQSQPFINSHNVRHDSLEQKIVHPSNQHTTRGSQRSILSVVQPVSSSSEPSVSVHKDSTLPTARSQDYESGSEHTTNDGVAAKLVDFHAKQPNITAGMDSNNKSAPQDKLNHIKNVAGSKKAATQSGSRIQDKATAAAKIKDGANHGKILPSSAHILASVLKAGAPLSENNIAKTAVPEVVSNTNKDDLSRECPKLDKAEYAGVGDSKLMKGKLNQERMEQKKMTYSRDNKAAVTIQAYWRGYRAREHNPYVVSVRKEIRARRAEDHIMLLRQELERNRRLYEEEKQLRILQMEAIRLLYKEVQDLKSHSLASSKDLNSVDGRTGICCSPSLLAVSHIDPDRTQELESLQKQVTQLQETLESVSCAVFGTNSLDGANLEFTDHSDKIRITPVSDEQFRGGYQSEETSHWGCIPHSLSPYPSEEEDIYYLQVSTRGAPTPPRCLQLRHHNQEALLLSWQPSSCSGQDWEEEGNKHIIGYRIYVNDHLKAFVCQKTSVLVEGLNASTTYKFYVKALSGFGESYESNIIMAKLAKGQERHKIPVNSGTDSSADSDKDVDVMERNEKLRYKNKKPRKSPRSNEKIRGTKAPSLYKRHQEAMSELGGRTSPVENANNNSFLNNTAFAILTHPKLHTHRRHRHQEKQIEGSRDCPSESTSQESSPCAGTSGDVCDNKGILHNPQVSFTPPSSTGSSNSRRLLEFSKTEAKKEAGATGGKDNSSVVAVDENSRARRKDSLSRKSESPPCGSKKQESPSHQRRKDLMETDRMKHTHVLPSSDLENENKQMASPKNGAGISSSKNSPSAGTGNGSGSQSSNFSETFTVDKAHSYLETVSAIAESVLCERPHGKQGSRSHKHTQSRDQLQEDTTCTDAGSKVFADLQQDCLSVEEAARLGIGKHREKIAFSDNTEEAHNREAEEERSDSCGKVKGHRRNRSRGQQEWKKDDTSEGTEKNREEDTESQAHRYIDSIRKTEESVGLSGVSEITSPFSLSSQPVIDGRRRHSSGSRPSSPVVTSGLGERSRLTVAEFMMEQKLKGLMKSISFNSLPGRVEDSGLRTENSRQSPSTESHSGGSQGDGSQYLVSSGSVIVDEASKGDSSRKAATSESITSTFTETLKKSQSNESLPGSTRTDTSKRSPSNESLPGSTRTDTSKRSPSNESLSESTHEEFERTPTIQSSKNSVGSPFVSQNLASCRRSHSMGSPHDLNHKEARDLHSSKTNSVVSKLLQKLENFTRNSSSAVRERKDNLKFKKSDSDERDSDAATSKPPSDDERRSGLRSRNLSDSDTEIRALDMGHQLPPRAPSDISSGSHSDDSRHSRRGHRRTPSDQRTSESSCPTHSPIIMEGAVMRKTSSSVRRNQSFHGLLPSKHQDAKAAPVSSEEVTLKAEEQSLNPSQSDSPAVSHIRSRTPSPARGRKPILSSSQLKCLADSSKPGPNFSGKNQT